MKIVVAVFIIAFIVRLCFAYIPAIKSIGMAYELIWGSGKSETGISAKENLQDRGSGDRYAAGSGSAFVRSSEARTVSGENKPDGSLSVESEEERTEDGEDGLESQKDGYFLTLDEVMAIEDINWVDKIMGLSILGKIVPEDVDRMLVLAEDGITVSEERELIQIFKRNLNKEDMDKLSDIMDRNKKLYAEGRLGGR